MITKFIFRKEIAQITEMSVQSVGRNEKSLGIEQFKLALNMRLIRYRRALVLDALRKKGYDCPAN